MIISWTWEMEVQNKRYTVASNNKNTATATTQIYEDNKFILWIMR